MLGLARALQDTTPRRLPTTLRAEAAYAELVLKTNRDADVSAESLSELLMECAGALSVSASDANAGTADEEAIFGAVSYTHLTLPTIYSV